MAPKKAALKEAEAELAVAMEVSVFTLSLSGFHSLPYLLLRKFPYNSIGVDVKAVPSLRRKVVKGTKRKR